MYWRTIEFRYIPAVRVDAESAIRVTLELPYALGPEFDPD